MTRTIATAIASIFFASVALAQRAPEAEVDDPVDVEDLEEAPRPPRAPTPPTPPTPPSPNVTVKVKGPKPPKPPRPPKAPKPPKPPKPPKIKAHKAGKRALRVKVVGNRIKVTDDTGRVILDAPIDGDIDLEDFEIPDIHVPDVNVHIDDHGNVHVDGDVDVDVDHDEQHGRHAHDEAMRRAEEEMERAREQMEKDMERAQEEMERAQEEMERARQEIERAREQHERTRGDQERREEIEAVRERMRVERERMRDERRREREEYRKVREQVRERHDQEDKGGDTTSVQTATVNGPVRLRLEIVRGDVMISTGSARKLEVRAEGCGSTFELEVDGDQVDVEFDDGGGDCTSIQVILPAGSSVEVGTTDGDVAISGAISSAEVAAVAGDVQIDNAANVEVAAVSGDIVLGNVSGGARIETVSGDAQVAMTGAAPRLDFRSTSGSLDFLGVCGRGCKIDAEAFSGDVVLRLDDRSSFELLFKTRDGDLGDGLGLQQTAEGRRKVKARYGKAEGQIDVRSFQGNLHVAKK